MAFDYARTAATAERLLTRFGQPLVYKAKREGTYDPATGKVTYGYLGEEWLEQEVQAVVLQFDLAKVDGTLIRMTDLRVLLAPTLAKEPRKGDVIVIPVAEYGAPAGFEEYEVVGSQTISPAGLVVLYEAQARKD
jgi:hypothetical protein